MKIPSFDSNSFVFSFDGNIKSLQKDLETSFNIDAHTYRIQSIFDDLNVYQLEFNHGIPFPKKLTTWFVEERNLQLYQDVYLQSRSLPNDAKFSEQWALELIQATKVWDFTTGGTSPSGKEIVIAVLDDGFDVEHEDLKSNIWINKDESPGDFNADGCPGNCGVDDDGDGIIDEDGFGNRQNEVSFDVLAIADDDENGFIDDIQGANIRNRNGFHSPRNHGTKVAGILGAQGNNEIGVAGVNWDVKLMLLSNTQRLSDLISGYNYMLKERQLFNNTKGRKGSFVVVSNLSSGIDGAFAIDFPIWCDLYDVLGRAGILSVCSTTNNDVFIDQEGDMPSTCPSEFLIAVNNTTRDDELYFSTGKSAVHIDLGAPGQGSYSTGASNSYGGFGGTSAAAPLVSGSIALLYSTDCVELDQNALENPAQAAGYVKLALMSGVDKIPSMTEHTLAGGRLNVYNSLSQLGQLCERTTGELNIEYIGPFSFNQFLIKYQTPTFEPIFLQILDTSGRLIFEKNLSPNLFGSKEFLFDLPHLSGGIYIATIYHEGVKFSKKFIFYSS